MSLCTRSRPDQVFAVVDREPGEGAVRAAALQREIHQNLIAIR
jgi:hypothetical protein